MPLSFRSPATALAAPDSPFAPLVGAGRRAAYRRRLVRRVMALALLVLAALLLIFRPGASAPATTDGATGNSPVLPAALPHGLSPTQHPTGPTASVDPTETRPGVGDSAGAEALPAGRIGMVVPIDAVLAARLRAGDLVDVYRAGSPKRVATEAVVVDVTRSAALPTQEFGPGANPDPATGDATVFLAVREREAGGIPAGQRGPDRATTGWWLAVLPRPVAMAP